VQRGVTRGDYERFITPDESEDDEESEGEIPFEGPTDPSDGN
jgi:hypothetical protein